MNYRDKKYELVIILALNGRLLTSLIPLQSSSLFCVRVSDKRLTNTSLKGIFVASTSRAREDIQASILVFNSSASFFLCSRKALS